MSVMSQGGSPFARNPLHPTGRDSRPADTTNAPRRRGRPPVLTPEEVLAEIRAAAEAGLLFRVHYARAALYARARRLWGSWSGALIAAGLEPRVIMGAARARANETRRRARETRPAGPAVPAPGLRQEENRPR
jgi:hypothetical protein